MYDFLQGDPGDDPEEGFGLETAPPNDYSDVLAMIMESIGGEGPRPDLRPDYDPIDAHRSALEASPYQGDRGLYPDTSTPEGRSQYDSQLNAAVTGPASLFGGPMGAAMGIADVEAQAAAEGKEPEAWQRGLGALGAIPGAGILRKVGSVPVAVKGQEVLAKVLFNLPLLTSVDNRLSGQVPKVQSMVNDLLAEYPFLSSGVHRVDLTSKLTNNYLPEENIVQLSPLQKLADEADYRGAGRGTPTLEKIGAHEGFHAGDRGSGDAIGGYEGFLSDFLGMGYGGHGIRGASSRFQPGELAKQVGGMNNAEMLMEEIKKIAPEILGNKFPQQLLREIEKSGRRYSTDWVPQDTIPTEMLATMFEDPDVLKNTPALLDFLEMMKSVVARDQAKYTTDLSSLGRTAGR